MLDRRLFLRLGASPAVRQRLRRIRVVYVVKHKPAWRRATFKRTHLKLGDVGKMMVQAKSQLVLAAQSA